MKSSKSEIAGSNDYTSRQQRKRLAHHQRFVSAASAWQATIADRHIHHPVLKLPLVLYALRQIKAYTAPKIEKKR